MEMLFAEARARSLAVASSMLGLSYQRRKALPKGLSSATSKRVPLSFSGSLSGASLPVRKPPAKGLFVICMCELQDRSNSRGGAPVDLERLIMGRKGFYLYAVK